MKKQVKLSCKTAMKKNAIDQKVFDREIALCKMLSSENNGKCGWGECDRCGVIPLLYKLFEGRLIEKIEELEAIKSKILQSKKT